SAEAERQLPRARNGEQVRGRQAQVARFFAADARREDANRQTVPGRRVHDGLGIRSETRAVDYAAPISHLLEGRRHGRAEPRVEEPAEEAREEDEARGHEGGTTRPRRGKRFRRRLTGEPGEAFETIREVARGLEALGRRFLEA